MKIPLIIFIIFFIPVFIAYAESEDEIESLYQKGLEFFNQNQFEDANDKFDELLEISPYAKDENDLLYIDKILQLEPNHLKSLYYKAKSLMTFENTLEEANSYFDKILEISPNHIDSLVQKGNVLLRLGQADDAIETLNKALLIEPGNPEALSQKGAILAKQGQIDEAMLYFDKVLEMDPNNVESLYNKADAYRMQQNHKEAFSYFYKVLEINPNHNLALAKIQLAAGHFGHKVVEGFIEVKIHDANRNLVSHMLIPQVGMLNHDDVKKMVEEWPIVKTMTKDGIEYDVHQFERIKAVKTLNHVWGGATHYGINLPNLQNLWLIYANYWMFIPTNGDIITYTYSIFTPVE